jgi:anaerobic selenocysteine-containing dehydrogenase
MDSSLTRAPGDVVRRPSVCPHDCPSVCALEVETIGGARIGRIHGAEDQRYTAGVVCAKVARYAERVHHKDRLKEPLRRVGPKASGQFQPIAWDDALDVVAENFLAAERRFCAESVWPYFYGGTMSLVMRDGLERLTHVERYSRFFGSYGGAAFHDAHVWARKG